MLAADSTPLHHFRYVTNMVLIEGVIWLSVHFLIMDRFEYMNSTLLFMLLM